MELTGGSISRMLGQRETGKDEGKISSFNIQGKPSPRRDSIETSGPVQDRTVFEAPMTSDNCEREVQIEVPVEEVKRETDSVTSGYRRVARIAGFRPGKAPAEIVRRRFWKDIRGEVLQNLLPRHFANALKEQKFQAVGTPKFEGLNFEENQAITCKAKFEILPEFEVGEYQGLEATEKVEPVTEEEIKRTLDQLRERIATFEVVEGRPAKDGDFLETEYQTLPDGEPSKAQAPRRALVELGAEGTPKEFSEHLRGVAAGETREFPVIQDSPSKSEGTQKTVQYRVTVHAIKKKNLPPVDDELAKSVSEVDTLKQLKSQLQEKLENIKKQQAQQNTMQELLRRLVDPQSFPVPETLVESELNRKLQQTAMELMTQGIDPRTTKIDWDKYRREWREAAEKQVRAQLILDKIAEAEKIEVSEEELDAKVREMAQQRGETPATLKSRLTEEDALVKLKFSCRQDKALEFIYRSAKLEGRGNSS